MNNFKYVNVSVHESNIKSKKGSYFTRVCKEGYVNERHLLYELKKRNTGIDVDVDMVEALMKKIKDIVFDFICQGYNVNFFNLGTFSLATSGQVKLKENIEGYEPYKSEQLSKVLSPIVQKDEKDSNGENTKDNKSYPPKVVSKYGDYDITKSINTNVQFKIKFSPSKEIKEDLKRAKIAFAIKKKRAPLIKKIDFPIPQSSPLSPVFLNIEGDALKVVGNSNAIGVYIEEKKSGIIKKIPKTSIIQNTPKNLLIMLEGILKKCEEYNVKIVTQYIEGSSSRVLRIGDANFVYEELS